MPKSRAPSIVELPKRPVGGRAPTRKLVGVDGRSRIARFLRDTTAELLKEISNPTLAQRTIARTTAVRMARLDAIEAELIASDREPFDDHRWMQWMGSIDRGLDALGLLPQKVGNGYRTPGKAGTGGITPAKRDGGTLADYLASREGRAA